MPSTWFSRLGLFVLVLVGLRIFFKWNISIVGSVGVTLLVYALALVFQSRGMETDRHSTDQNDP